MLFNSGQFLLFFPVVIVLYFLFPHRFRWLFLLAASYFFYMCWRPEYIVLILGSTIVDYFLAREIRNRQNSGDKAMAKRLLWTSIGINLGILFSFKYFNFFTESVSELLQAGGMDYMIPALDVVLPVGISFYTFQTMSYTIDVYQGKTEPEKHFGIFALFVSFWPQLVAGPIERSNRLLPQFRRVVVFDQTRVIWGLNRMAYGFFKKVVVADRLAIYVNEVYGDVGEYSTIPLLLASVFFAIQIYCDFSGYTDIAIGVAAIMGFQLMENFDRPYLSRSIGEFWRRWHISLSSWFRDYLYIPLGGNRVVKWRWHYNLFLTFLISGLWHGANWTFVIWGALHGSYLIFENLSKKSRVQIFKKLKINPDFVLVRLGQVLLTFTLVLIGWVFFRAGSLEDALFIFKKIASVDLNFDPGKLMAYKGIYNFGLSFLAVGLLALSYLLPKHFRFRYNLLFVVICSILILFLGKGGEGEFIYFQF